jgi:hypothetical protein
VTAPDLAPDDRVVWTDRVDQAPVTGTLVRAADLPVPGWWVVRLRGGETTLVRDTVLTPARGRAA